MESRVESVHEDYILIKMTKAEARTLKEFLNSLTEITDTDNMESISDKLRLSNKDEFDKLIFDLQMALVDGLRL